MASDNQGIKFPPASIFTQLEMHTHFVGLDNAFSSSDLYRMTKLSADSNNSDATAILVAPSGKLFALKVTNQSKADAFKNFNEQDGEKKMKELYDYYVLRWAQITCNGCTVAEFENLISNYLVFYLTQIWDSGLTLYEATEDSDGNITWDEVIYTP